MVSHRHGDPPERRARSGRGRACHGPASRARRTKNSVDPSLDQHLQQIDEVVVVDVDAFALQQRLQLRRIAQQHERRNLSELGVDVLGLFLRRFLHHFERALIRLLRAGVVAESDAGHSEV